MHVASLMILPLPDEAESTSHPVHLPARPASPCITFPHHALSPITDSHSFHNPRCDQTIWSCTLILTHSSRDAIPLQPALFVWTSPTHHCPFPLIARKGHHTYGILKLHARYANTFIHSNPKKNLNVRGRLAYNLLQETYLTAAKGLGLSPFRHVRGRVAYNLLQEPYLTAAKGLGLSPCWRCQARRP
jgi:hypothetical protein